MKSVFSVSGLMILLSLSTAVAAAELTAVVDDVITAKVVAVRVLTGKLKPGDEFVILRDGKKVGRLKVQTSTGVCKVLEGRAQVGDRVKPAADTGRVVQPETTATGTGTDPSAPTPAVVPEGPLKNLLTAEGHYLLGRYAAKSLEGRQKVLFESDRRNAETALPALRAAVRAYHADSLRERVALALKDQGRADLAAEVNPDRESAAPPMSPILPPEAKAFDPLPFGQFALLNSDPGLWALPQFWGRPPIDPIFTGISFGEDSVALDQDSDALVRRDLKLDDLEMTGEVKLEKGRFLYLLLRSEVVVKFSHHEQAPGVSAKIGYNNLSQISAAGSQAPLDTNRWYQFRVRLVHRQLQVYLNEKEVLATTVSVDPNFAGKLPSWGHVGFGARHAAGSFRKLRVRALSYAGRRALPVFAPQTKYRAVGKKRSLLGPGNTYVSLFNNAVKEHLSENHPVNNGILQIKGAAYSQFSVKGTEADHFRVSGRLRVQAGGTVWIRANRSLLFGLLARPPTRDNQAETEQVFFVKHNPGDFHSYDEAFKGNALLPNQWYEWTLEYHDPVGWFKLNGETIMLSRSPSDRGADPGPNQFGISAYNVNADIRDLAFQKMRPEDPPKLSTGELREQFRAARRQIAEAIDALKQDDGPGARIAVEILQGKRAPMTAGVQDYIQLADQLRDKHQWPLALRILQANFERFPKDAPLRREAERSWRLTQQKFEIAQDNVALGELGLDNLMRLGNKEGVISQAADPSRVWIYVPAQQELRLFHPQTRQAKRILPLKPKPEAVLARDSYLLVADEQKTRIRKLDAATGKQLGELELPKGTILDWVQDPHQAVSYVSVDTNTGDAPAVRNYRIYRLHEGMLTLDDTGGFGMQLAIDPHGRYLYSAFRFRLTRMTRNFSPDPLNIDVQPGGHVDHLLSFRLDKEELVLLSDRASPGLAGTDMAADPSGRMICYVARGGFLRDLDRDNLGFKVPAFRAGNIRTTVGVFDSGKTAQQIAFNPLLPQAYIYDGKQVQVFSSRDFEPLDLIPLPTDIPLNSGTELLVSGDGAFLLLAYADKTAGVYLHPLRMRTGTEPAAFTALQQKPVDELIATARERLVDGRTEEGRKILELLVQTRGFSPAAEAAARELLKLETSFLLNKAQASIELPTPELQDLPQNPEAAAIQIPPAGKNVHQPQTTKYSNRESYRQQLADLESYRSLTANYPYSWLWMCHRLIREFPDAPNLILLAARELAALERPAAAQAAVKQLLQLVDSKGWYAMKAYAVLADLAAARQDHATEIAARHAALAINPRNPFMHGRLGSAYRAAGAANRAHYHELLSLKLFPSQPALRSRLVAAEMIEPLPPPQEQSIEEIYQAVSPSVVLVKQRIGAGTGFFITRDGLLLTNHHVIAGGEDVLRIQLHQPGQESPATLPARLVASDPRLDIAILAVELDKLRVEPLIIGDADPPRTGMNVIAIGNPGMGAQVLSRTVTEGIISNIRQQVGGQAYIQTSAAVNPGNSGGPLLNRNGKVIGMVTLKAHLDNVGFAIPTDRLLNYIEEQLN